MANKTPQKVLLVDYKIIFNEEPPENLISIISHLSPEQVLAEIASINFRIKPSNSNYFNKSRELQYKILQHLTRYKELYDKYLKVYQAHIIDNNHHPIIFNRYGCLYAMEQIVNSKELFQPKTEPISTPTTWESILKFLLACNFKITIRDEIIDESPSIESMNPRLLGINEHIIEENQLAVYHRGYLLITYLMMDSDYSSAVLKYFKETYSLTPLMFIYNIMNIVMGNNASENEHRFFYQLKPGQEKIFKELSTFKKNAETFKLLTLRKSPLIELEQLKYILSDNSFLIDKVYNMFINDFWFDRIKRVESKYDKKKYSITNYRGKIGYFFEFYIERILRASFNNYNHSTLLLFNELSRNSRKGKVEVADIYLRHNRKILLGEAKASAIYDDEKYGGTTDLLYKNDREKFFDNFGLKQLIKNIIKLEKEIVHFDPKFPVRKVYQIFPILIVNEKNLQSPFMAHVFHERFKERISTHHFTKITVHPLNILYIGDLERMQTKLEANPKIIWNLLNHNISKKSFIPPFYQTINDKLPNLPISKEQDNFFKLITNPSIE